MLYCITLGPGIYVDQFDTPLWSEQVWCAANALVPDSTGSPRGLVPLRVRAKSDPWWPLWIRFVPSHPIVALSDWDL